MNIDWRKFLAQYDLIYKMQSRVWQDGTALGNGSLGALAYEPFHLEWTVNKNDVWDYRHPKFKRHTMAEIRAMVAKGLPFAEEMSKENIAGVGLYPCPKTCGQVRIRFGMDSIYAPGHRISKRLSLHDATLHTHLDKHLSHPRISSFICAEENVLVIRAREISAMTAFHNHVDLYRVPDAQMPPVKKGAGGDTIWLEQLFPDGFRFVLMARVAVRGRAACRELFKQTVQEKWWYTIEPSKNIESRLDGGYAVAPVCGDFDVFVTVVTSHDATSPLAAARRVLDRAVRTGSEKLDAEHRRWWAAFWKKSYAGFSDPLLEQLWYTSLYHQASVLRGTPVGGLCGLWYGPVDTPSQILPWLGSYTNDYNAQLPVMSMFRVNHPELADGTFRTLLAQLPQARRNARELYGLPGAFYPLNSDPTGEEISGGAYRLVQVSGPYWCVFLWWHYCYTGDVAYLREVGYPILREVATFFTQYLRWHPGEGRYHLEISQNAELMYVKYDDPVDTLAFLKHALRATVQAANILGCDGKLVEQCRHVLAHYPEYARHGLEISPLRGLRANHLNHLRTLAALFPCGEFDPEVAPEWKDSCLFEIEKGDFWYRNYACNRGRLGGWTGMAYHVGLPLCWLGMKKRAWEILEELLKVNVKPNGLVSHNWAILADSRRSEQNILKIPDAEIYHDLDPEPLKAVELLTGRLGETTTENLDCRDTIFPSFEGPSVYLLLLGEMLLQSQNGILRPFPGLPDDQDAAFHDLRAQGPTLVSSARKNGRVSFLRLKALAAVDWKVKNPWPGRTVYRKSGRVKKIAAERGGEYIEVHLRRGEDVVLSDQENNLFYEGQIRLRKGESARPRCKVFDDGMLVWLGKPEPSEYYASLEKAREGKKQDSGFGDSGFRKNN